ncbi:MAG TPA: hypothetical protein VGQ39_19750 [Pyrinomonadaceae bacterium]|nr:hypothetical protein [Pyrinomonadaceae bacterium]
MFTRSTFDPYAGGLFQAPNARGELITLTLLNVTTYKTQRSTKISTKTSRETDCFSLLFKASSQLPPFTSIHTISHPALGTFDLFLTPRQFDGDWFYEAVINHLV